MSNEKTRIVNQQELSRRSFLRTSSAGVLSFLNLPMLVGCTGNVLSTIDSIATTEYGLIRGKYQNGIHSFKGVPYGAPTGGAARFMAAEKPSPWTGVRDVFDFGAMSYQFSTSESPATDEQFLKDRMPTSTLSYWDALIDGDGSGYRVVGFEGEDCLVLNIKTPALRDNKKRPVMVWLHGGGFTAGSGNIFTWDDYLAKSQDVVVVSINHRLNIFGHLYLAELGGEQYADSGNAGMLDIVMALEWVRDNITEFGGDPNNVTIFGQSGG